MQFFNINKRPIASFIINNPLILFGIGKLITNYLKPKYLKKIRSTCCVLLEILAYNKQ